MNNGENSSFDVQDILRLIIVAVDPTDLTILVLKLDWPFKQRSELGRDWGDLQRIRFAEGCSIYFIQNGVFDL